MSTTFDKYCYVNVRHLPRFFNYSTELSYSKTERVTSIENIQHPEDQRVRILNALKVVDHAELVTIEETDDKMLALKKFKFNVLFSGDDWKGSERYIRTEKQFSEYGAAIEYLPYTKGISTTEIKGKINGDSL